VDNLKRETTEGQWPKKRTSSPSRRHKRNRSLKNKEVVEPTTEVSMGECNFHIIDALLLAKKKSVASPKSVSRHLEFVRS